MGALGIDARSSRELQAVIIALAGARKDVQGLARQYTRERLLPEWKSELLSRAMTRQEVRLAESGRTKVSNQNVTLEAAGVGSSKSLDIKQLGRAVEFGADRAKVSTYRRRSKNGGQHDVRRRTQTGFRRPRSGGYVVFPTVKDMVPRFASLWVQTVVRTFHEALEER